VNLLVFNLVVEVTSEPVIEPALLDISGTRELHGDPVHALVRVDVHGQMRDLSAPYKPVALKEPDEEIPAQTSPEATQQGCKLQMEEEIEC